MKSQGVGAEAQGLDAIEVRQVMIMTISLLSFLSSFSLIKTIICNHFLFPALEFSLWYRKQHLENYTAENMKN